MGLKKATTFKSIQLNSAYYRAVLPQIDACKNTMSFSVWVFQTQENATDQSNMLGDLTAFYFGIPYDIAGVNPLKQAYMYLKSLPEFEGAQDVFEAGQGV